MFITLSATPVGITANATGLSGPNNTVTYTLSDDANGRFAIDSATGVVTTRLLFANSGDVVDTPLDYETDQSHTIEVTAASSDGRTSTQTFTIDVLNQTSGYPQRAGQDPNVIVPDRCRKVSRAAWRGYVRLAGDPSEYTITTIGISGLDQYSQWL